MSDSPWSSGQALPVWGRGVQRDPGSTLNPFTSERHDASASANSNDKKVELGGTTDDWTKRTYTIKYYSPRKQDPSSHL